MPPSTPLFFSLSIDLLYRKAYIIVKKEKMPLEQKPKYTKTVRVSELVRDIKSGEAPESFNSLIDKIMSEGAKRRLTEFKHEGRTVKFDWTDNPKDPLLTFEAEVHPLVFVIQEIAGTRHGAPKINIIGATKYGKFKFLLPELSQIIFSPGPLIFRLREKLKYYREVDYLLLTGDPAIIGVACSIVSDITNGKYKLLKWDKQERKYYPIEINLHEKGNKDE